MSVAKKVLGSGVIFVREEEISFTRNCLANIQALNCAENLNILTTLFSLTEFSIFCYQHGPLYPLALSAGRIYNFFFINALHIHPLLLNI